MSLNPFPKIFCLHAGKCQGNLVWIIGRCRGYSGMPVAVNQQLGRSLSALTAELCQKAVMTRE
jgi:hypothetical protein